MLNGKRRKLKCDANEGKALYKGTLTITRDGYTEYKAARYGIIVRKVNPCYNAQICSICGGWDKDQRLSRADFICKDPNCISHKKYKHPQCAEFNNARNVAMSELFMESGKVTGKDFERARAYYSKKNPGIIWEFVESKE